MRITLNLATHPYANLAPHFRRLRIAMAVLAGISILSGLGLYFFGEEARQSRAREHNLDAQIAQVRAESQNAEATMRRPDNAQLLAQTQTLNHIFDDKSFSWTLAMEAMESVLPPGVQVTAIEPIHNKDGHITVHLRVSGPHDRAVEMVRNLERSRRFLAPRIVGENAQSGSGSNQRQEPVSASNHFDFDVEAEYNPPAPGERAAAAATEKPVTEKPAAEVPKARPQQPIRTAAAVTPERRNPRPGPPMPPGQAAKPNPAHGGRP
jgi:type IV pilus assembly protein PilN